MASYLYTCKTLVDEVMDRAKDNSLSRSLVLSFISDTHSGIFNRRIFPQQEKDFSGALSQGAYEFVMPKDMSLPNYVELDDEDGNTYKPVYDKSRDFFEYGIADKEEMPQFYTIFKKITYLS